MEPIEFLALTWWIWLILAIVCYSYAMVKFFRKMKRDEQLHFDERFDKFLEGFTQIIIAALIGTICFFLFILGLIPACIQVLIQMIT